MRLFAAGIGALLCVSGSVSCSPAATPDTRDSTVRQGSAETVDLRQVGDTRSDIPAGFEFADLAGRVAPVAQWGLGAGWTADPQACASLADPPVDPLTVRGWSASGPGAIVFVVAAATTAGVDPAPRAECTHFSVAAGHTAGGVATIDAPVIADAQTHGLRAETATVVEGGTETHSHAETLTAYLKGNVVYVTVVTDPGSGESEVGDDFAARLLTSTTSAVRGR